MSDRTEGSSSDRFAVFFSRALLSTGLFLLVLTPIAIVTMAGTGTDAMHLLTLSLGFAGAFFLFLQMIFDWRLRVPWGWPVLLAAGMLLIGVASGLFSDCPQAAIMTLLTWVGYLAVFLLGTLMGRGDAGRKATRAICALALPLAVYAVLQYGVLLDKLAETIREDKTTVLARMGLSERDYEALLRRAESKRAFGTFALPTSLAAFFLLTIPPSVAFAASARTKQARSLSAAVVALAAIGLFLTFSKGGWLVASMVLIFFLVVQGRSWLRQQWKTCGIAVLAAALTMGIFYTVSPGLRGRLGAMRHEFSASARVRGQYWTAGLSMWRTRPVLGVGPGNFRHHYLRHKPVAAEEVRHAHNDYVQLLAEGGPAAAVLYGLFWLTVLAIAWRGVRKSTTETGPVIEPGPDHVEKSRPLPARWLVPAAGLCGIAMAELLARPMSITESDWVNRLAFLAFAALWAVGYALFGLFPAKSQSRRPLQIGLVAGLLALALHSFLDPNLYVEGVATVAFALAGIVSAPTLRHRTVQLRAGQRLVVLIVGTVFCLGVLFAVSRASLARTTVQQGEAVLGQLRAADRPDEVRRLAAQGEAIFSEAVRGNPFDFRAHLGRAECLEIQLALHSTRENFSEAVSAWRSTIRRNPSVAEFHWRLGELFANYADRFPSLISDRYAPDYIEITPPLPSPVRDVYRPAVANLTRAAELAPTSPRVRLRYGRVLKQAGLAEAATEQFHTALELNRRMIEGRAPERQLLGPAERDEIKRELKLIETGGGGIIHFERPGHR